MSLNRSMLRSLRSVPHKIQDMHPLRESTPKGFFLKLCKFMWKDLLICSALSAVASLINLSSIWCVAWLIDQLHQQQAALVPWQAVVAAGIALLLIDPWAQYVTSERLSAMITIPSMARLLWNGYKSLEVKDIHFHSDNLSGRSVSRIKVASRAIQRQLVLLVNVVPRVIVQVIGSIIMLSHGPSILLIPIAIWVLLNLVVTHFSVRRFITRATQTSSIESISLGRLTELYNNFTTVKASASEHHEAQLYKRLVRKLMSAVRREEAAQSISDLHINLANGLLLSLTFGLGSFSVTSSEMTLGEFAAAMMISRSLASHSRAFMVVSQSISYALGTISDALPVLSGVPSVRDADDAKILPRGAGEISFNNVSFSYQSGRPAITNFTLKIRKGEKVGIVGRSGAGKTTLLNLLLRLYDVDCGSITIDGVDIRTVTQHSLRSNIAVIQQEPVLFHRSVADNIGYGGYYRMDQIITAARQARAHDFITDIEDPLGRHGYDAQVGERGARLSGGQRQRIILARVLARDSSILLLDEPTSSLDSEMQAALSGDFAALTKGKTVITVAHRLSTIFAMDRVVVMDHGVIVEEGAPHYLRSAQGLFATLCNQEFFDISR